MDDLSGLARWVHEQHLDQARLQAYSRSFVFHPARVLELIDILRPGVLEGLSEFLRIEATFRERFQLYSCKEGVSRSQWNRSAPEDRFYHFLEMSGVSAEFRVSPNVFTLLQFRNALCQEFPQFFERLSGCDLDRSPELHMHLFRPGDYLGVHTDRALDRRLGFAFCLSADWGGSDGGVTTIVHRDGEKTEILPTRNTLLIFDVEAHAEHFVPPAASVAPADGRLSIGGWYHTRHRRAA